MSRVRGAGFYPSGCITHLNADVEAECSNAGIKGPQAVAAAQAKARAQWQPVIDENPEMTPQELRDLRRAKALPPAGPELKAHNERLIGENTMRIYRTKAQVMKLGALEDAEVRTKPATNAVMKAGAGSSAPVFRQRIVAREAKVKAP
jgi:hypothetical protein